MFCIQETKRTIYGVVPLKHHEETWLYPTKTDMIFRQADFVIIVVWIFKSYAGCLKGQNKIYYKL